jgi:PAS domain-containing protein
VRLDAAECALAERDARSAIGHALAAMAIDPYAERAHRLAMLAHYAQGDQRESLAGYQRLRSLLSRELGVEPTPRTRQVRAAILAQEDPACLLPRPLERQGPPPRPDDGPLIGRRAQLGRLEALVGEACDSALAIAVVEGEDGAGKTRLLAELAARLPGPGVGRAACSQLERHLPYVPLASALREALGAPAIAGAGQPALAAVFPELGPGPAGPPAPETAALESLVALWRSRAPLVLLLDDLHWADPATMAALAYLRRRSAVLPGAVIATAAAEQAPASAPLRRLPASARIALPPLTPGELAEAGLEHLHAPTQGHPRLLAATLAAGDRAQALASLADVLLARCRAEGPAAYSLLVCAAALEQPFDPAALARGTGQGPEQALAHLESLREHRLLEAAGLGYRFRHEMVAQALRQSLSPALRRFLADRAEPARPAPGRQEPSPSGFDAVDHPIYVIDPARDRIVEANRACEWLGYSHDELLATPVSAIHPAEYPQLVDWVTQVRSDQIGWSCLFNCRAKDGTYTPTDMMALAPDPNGLVVIFTKDRSAHRSLAA